MTAVRVLLVEDHPAQADLARRALSEVREAQFEVTWAKRLSEGIEQARTGTYQVVLLDLSLPDSHGLATVERFLKAAGDLPVVVLTSFHDERMGYEAVKAGAQDYLVKDSVHADVLGRVLRYATERHHYRLERQAAQERERELERLRELDRLKSQFFDLASHELNTPLTPLKMQVDLLRSGVVGPLTEKQKKATDIIYRSVDRLARLVEEMLDINRVQRRGLRLKKEPVDLNAIVMEAVELFREPIRQGRIELSVKMGPELPIDADPRRLSQVLINLLSNALKFTPPDGSIIVYTEARETDACVLVQDTGPGMTPDQLSRLFLPFSQVHPAENAKHPGTGLGLYISKGIVEQHGGRIEAMSRGPDLGATFTVSVPLRSSALVRTNGAGKPRTRPLDPVGAN